MRKRIGWLVIPIVFIIIGIFIYLFFNEGENIYTHRNQKFTMKVKDLAEIDDKIYLKFTKVIDNTCKSEECSGEGETLAKILVINNPHFEYIELSNKIDKEITIKKTNYKIKLIDFNTENNEITLEVLSNE